MIETKYVKKLTCDACGHNEEIICDEYDMCDLTKGAPDWMRIKFERFGMNESERKHLCPDCSKKFFAMFVKENVNEEENRRCEYCNSFNRHIHSNHGWCDLDGMSVNAYSVCDRFDRYMPKSKESDNVDADGNVMQCKKCFYFEFGVCKRHTHLVYSNHFCDDFTGM